DPHAVTGLTAGQDYNAADFGYQQLADLRLQKTVDDPSPDFGDNVTFTITVTNDGPFTATNVAVEDLLPASLDFVSDNPSQGSYNNASGIWTVGDIASGDSATLEIVVQVNATGTLTNIAQVNASDQSDPDSTPDNDDGDQSEDDEDSASVTVPIIIDPAVTKSGDPAVASVGDIVIFTITVTNNGNTDALGVELQDIVPTFLDIVDVVVSPARPYTTTGNTIDITIGIVSPGDTFTITITTQVNDLGQPPGGMNNTTLTTTSLDDDLTNNADDAFLSIIAAALPDTGFPPHVRTWLPPQPTHLSYTSFNYLWLEIPALAVETPIVGVPLTENGWDVTWLWNNAGYMHGTAFPTWPGNTGITGHVTLPTGFPGPFANLDKLIWGDKIIIHAGGYRYIYEVREAARVDPENMSLLEHKEYDWLTLITCEGYDRAQDTYFWRRVVGAVLVERKLDLLPIH
nr:sortase [Anaerolineales bacterium]